MCQLDSPCEVDTNMGTAISLVPGSVLPQEKEFLECWLSYVLGFMECWAHADLDSTWNK